MTRLRRLLPWFAALAAVALVLAHYDTRSPALSVDEAWHYIMVDYFANAWNPFHAVRPHTPDMVGYPPLSHLAAAIAGSLGRSNFHVMLLSGMGFVVLLYLFMFKGLTQASAVRTAVCMAVLAGVILAIRPMRATYGNEIAGNFFYAQAAGEALMLGLLWWLSGRPRREAELILGPVFVLVIGWIYPGTQVKFAVALLFLWFVHLVDLWRGGRLALRPVLATVALGVLVVVCTVRHPAFRYMRGVAEHNGGIYPSYGLPLFVALSAVVAAGALALALWARTGRSILTRPLFLASAAAGVGVSALLQYIAWRGLGMGSEYAVRKHFFGVTTLVIALAIVACAELLQRVWPARIAPSRAGGLALPVLPAVAAGMLAVFFYPGLGLVDFRPFLRYEREVLRFQPEGPGSSLRGIAVSKVAELPIEWNFIISMVDLKIRKELAVEETLRVDIPDEVMRRGPDQSSLRYAIVSPVEAAALPPTCRLPNGTLSLGVVVRFGCQ